ncbi:Uncharacterized protein TCM_025379 [Theobroma cacao]|uniref:Uncharacterized protein n=1 Tax=Theobroma cacao TaxID=3641 RepID=A0A061F661_THECC|nr:Uncharacterized protein TCM_025379 [Theobroma cacao]
MREKLAWPKMHDYMVINEKASVDELVPQKAKVKEKHQNCIIQDVILKEEIMSLHEESNDVSQQVCHNLRASKGLYQANFALPFPSAELNPTIP